MSGFQFVKLLVTKTNECISVDDIIVANNERVCSSL